MGDVLAHNGIARPVSALPPKADIVERDRHVRHVPEADICTAAKVGAIRSLGRHGRESGSEYCGQVPYGIRPYSITSSAIVPAVMLCSTLDAGAANRTLGALGQERTSEGVPSMSALPLKADID
jgi:hypothetical protein